MTSFFRPFMMMVHVTVYLDHPLSPLQPFWLVLGTCGVQITAGAETKRHKMAAGVLAENEVS